MIELETAVGKTKNQMIKIIQIMEEVSISQQLIEKRVETQHVIREDTSKEYLHLIDEVRAETLEEAEFVAQSHCHASAGAQPQDTCCEDCAKSHWRVPAKELCDQAGCSHSCGYDLKTCNIKGVLQDPCHFPFKHGGKKHHKCIHDSPFGVTKRPWCKTKKHKVVFCDCPVVKCTCPSGGKLADDGKTCSGAALLETKSRFPPLGLAQLPQPNRAQAELHPSNAASLLQYVSSMWR